MSIFDFLNFKKRNREYQERIEEKLRKRKNFLTIKKILLIISLKNILILNIKKDVIMKKGKWLYR